MTRKVTHGTRCPKSPPQQPGLASTDRTAYRTLDDMAKGKRPAARWASPRWVDADDLPASNGHPFFERLKRILEESGFDAFVEQTCAPFYAERRRRSSLRPGRYFRLLLIGYFEGLSSERGIAWRVSDSLSLRSFLDLDLREAAPDHSTLSRTRRRIDEETHKNVFTWVLERAAEADLVRGKKISIEATTLEAKAAMRSIARRGTGESHETFLRRLAEASGIATPTRAELARFGRLGKAKTASNMSVRFPHELAVGSQSSDREGGPRRWQDGRTGETPPEKEAARKAVYGNRRRTRGGRGRRLQRRRGELVERPVARRCETGGLRRVWVRAHENVRKRVLIGAAGCNLGPLLRRLTGIGRPRSLQGRAKAAEETFCVRVRVTSGEPMEEEITYKVQATCALQAFDRAPIDGLHFFCVAEEADGNTFTAEVRKQAGSPVYRIRDSFPTP